MLDPRLLKEGPQLIMEMLRKRSIHDFPFNELVNLDRRRRELIVRAQDLRQKKNIVSESIVGKKKASQEVASELEQMKTVSVELGTTEKEMVQVEERFIRLMMTLPNMLHESVPVGAGEKDNKLLRHHGEPRKLEFDPRDHVDIATHLDQVDLERAAKVSGARFYFLKNELVKMNYALVQFALDFLSRRGYVPLQPPYMIRKQPMSGAIVLGDFQDVVYKIEGEDLYMIGTSEHAIAAMHMDEILDGKKLPLKYGGVSPCFRKEAGAHGKDMKGIFRVHQFEKVEQYVYCRPEESWQQHEKMIGIAEEFFDKLGLPYRVVLLCSGDTGKVSAKTYDLEAWMTGQNAYREIVSCSNCTDYQARRLRIRFRDKTNEETRLVHTLNSTLVATERTMVAIMENYQTRDGSIIIPEELRKYMGDLTEIKPRA